MLTLRTLAMYDDDYDQCTRGYTVTVFMLLSQFSKLRVWGCLEQRPVFVTANTGQMGVTVMGFAKHFGQYV